MLKEYRLSPLMLFIWVIIVEAILSLINLSLLPGGMAFAKLLSHVFPVVNNLRINEEIYSGVQVYAALTCMLVPLKVYLSYLLISQLSESDKALVVAFPMSNASFKRKIVNTFIVFIISIGLAYYVFNYGEVSYFNSEMYLNSASRKYQLVIAGGLKMWLGWAVMHLAILSLILGLLFAFIKEWIQFILNINNADKE